MSRVYPARERALTDVSRLAETGKSLDDCLRLYPQFEREIREYFRMLAALGSASQALPAGRQERGREALLAAVARARSGPGGRPGLRRRAGTVAGGLLLAGALTAGAAYGSSMDLVQPVQAFLEDFGVVPAGEPRPDNGPQDSRPTGGQSGQEAAQTPGPEGGGPPAAGLLPFVETPAALQERSPAPNQSLPVGQPRAANVPAPAAEGFGPAERTQPVVVPAAPGAPPVVIPTAGSPFGGPPSGVDPASSNPHGGPPSGVDPTSGNPNGGPPSGVDPASGNPNGGPPSGVDPGSPKESTTDSGPERGSSGGSNQKTQKP